MNLNNIFYKLETDGRTSLNSELLQIFFENDHSRRLSPKSGGLGYWLILGGGLSSPKPLMNFAYAQYTKFIDKLYGVVNDLR